MSAKMLVKLKKPRSFCHVIKNKTDALNQKWHNSAEINLEHAVFKSITI